MDKIHFVINGKDSSELWLYGLLAMCVLSVLFPRLAWWWSEGWKFRGHVEPSRAYLLFTRIGGLLGAAVVLYMLQHPEQVTTR